MKFTSLETKNCILKKFKISDVNKGYFDWLKDKENSKYLTNYQFKNVLELKISFKSS